MTKSSGRDRDRRNVERCTFCEKSRHHVKSLIAGPPGIYICDECIDICNSILLEEERHRPGSGFSGASGRVKDYLFTLEKLLKPREIKARNSTST